MYKTSFIFKQSQKGRLFMKKQITYALLLITAVIATQSISANYSNRYGKNGAGQQRIIGGQGGRQLAPQVGSEGLGRYNLQQGRVEGEMSTMPVYGNPRRTNGEMSTMPVYGNPGRTEGYGSGEMSANKAQYRYNQ
jgi:hypothetical protein